MIAYVKQTKRNHTWETNRPCGVCLNKLVPNETRREEKEKGQKLSENKISMRWIKFLLSYCPNLAILWGIRESNKYINMLKLIKFHDLELLQNESTRTCIPNAPPGK